MKFVLHLLPDIMYHAKRKTLKSQNPKREPKIQAIMDFGSCFSVFWHFDYQIIHQNCEGSDPVNSLNFLLKLDVFR